MSGLKLNHVSKSSKRDSWCFHNSLENLISVFCIMFDTEIYKRHVVTWWDLLDSILCFLVRKFSDSYEMLKSVPNSAMTSRHNCYPKQWWPSLKTYENITTPQCDNTTITRNNVSYTLGREYRVMRNRYSRLLFTSEDRICANLRVREQPTNMTSQF